jgi:hypothetical protein
MFWKRIKLPRLPLARIPWQRPNRATMKKIMWGGLLVAALVGAFYWGHHGGINQARAQYQSSIPSITSSFSPQGGGNGDYSRRVVAYIFGNRAITREELGEYLIERVGADRVDFLVNRRIIEMACGQKNIKVTDAEIDAQLAEDLKGFQCTEKQFVNDILRRYNKTLFEWREDVIRPKLALQRLVQDQIAVNDDDIQKGFEAKFGEKVECRIIVLAEHQGKDKYDIWQKVKDKPEEFDRVARSQFIGPLAAEGGKIPPIHRHFGDPNIEKEAFKLHEGEISPLIGMPDGTTVILLCVKKIPPDTTKVLAQERMGLYREIADMRLAAEIPRVFQMLRKEANPQIFLKRETPAPDPMAQGARPPQGGNLRPTGMPPAPQMPAAPQTPVAPQTPAAPQALQAPQVPQPPAPSVSSVEQPATPGMPPTGH